MFPCQAAVCQVLLAGTRHMCAGSPGLLQAHRTLTALLRRACAPRLSRLLALAVRGRDAATGGAGSSRDLRDCTKGQAALILLPGFVGATLNQYRRELRERRSFLAARMEAAGSRARAEAAEMRTAAAASCLNFASFAVPALAAMYIWGTP